jgi:hypothetical protein
MRASLHLGVPIRVRVVLKTPFAGSFGTMTLYDLKVEGGLTLTRT